MDTQTSGSAQSIVTCSSFNSDGNCRITFFSSSTNDSFVVSSSLCWRAFNSWLNYTGTYTKWCILDCVMLHPYSIPPFHICNLKIPDIIVNQNCLYFRNIINWSEIDNSMFCTILLLQLKWVLVSHHMKRSITNHLI